MKKYILFVTVIFSGIVVEAQQDSIAPKYNFRKMQKEWAVLVGFNAGDSFFGDIGFGINEYGSAGPHPIAVSFTAGSEIQFRHTDKLIGPKISMHMMGGSALGFNLIHYTNFKKTSLVFRPEVGFGVQRFKMTYGYNFRLSKRDNFASISSHLFSLMCLIHVAKHEEEQMNR